jgi:hypothetical protein
MVGGGGGFHKQSAVIKPFSKFYAKETEIHHCFHSLTVGLYPVESS